MRNDEDLLNERSFAFAPQHAIQASLKRHTVRIHLHLELLQIERSGIALSSRDIGLWSIIPGMLHLWTAIRGEPSKPRTVQGSCTPRWEIFVGS